MILKALQEVLAVRFIRAEGGEGGEAGPQDDKPHTHTHTHIETNQRKTDVKRLDYNYALVEVAIEVAIAFMKQE